MSQKQELENLVLEKLSDIEKFGFAKPIVNRQKWSTVIDWLHDKIALEVELDWRDFDLFLLIVNLDNGNLPKGYYVSDGKVCRLHLQEAIKQHGWSVDQNALVRISPEGNYSQQDHNAVEIKERLENYRRVLMSCIHQLVIESASIFQS